MKEVFSRKRVAERAQANRELKAAIRDRENQEALERNFIRKRRMAEGVMKFPVDGAR